MLIIFVIIISCIINCSHQLHIDFLDKKLEKNLNIKYIALCSYDPFGSITKAIYIELYKNNIFIVNDVHNNLNIQDTCIYLYIIDTSEIHTTTSVFSDGTEAGYQLILYIHTKLVMPDKSYYPINIKVQRAFMRNSQNALYNNTQEDDIRILMYQEIAEKIIFYINLQYKNFYDKNHIKNNNFVYKDLLH